MAEYQIGEQFMPDERDIPKLPRQWVVNLAYTLIGDEFRDWVKNRIEERNAKIVAN